MKIMKRSGIEADFDVTKISAAIKKANCEVAAVDQLSEEQIEEISTNVEKICSDIGRTLGVEEIQDLVEDQIMNKRAFVLARKYITYRYTRALIRKSNSTDKQILSLLECNNEEAKQENSNKNPTVNSVQRDYMAGEVSKDITKRFLLPEDIVAAHEQGIIHFHDSDYFAQHMHNCCLVNLEDMLIQYQVITLMTTNGQAPFVTVFMYLDEVPEGRLRDDLALVTEEILRQRIQGVKNEKGVYITPAFPKLIYVLEEDNITEGSKYWELTKLAAKCTAKRMVPDYISEKIMRKLKDGNCYPCMGCRSFLTVYHDENDKPKFYGRFNQGVVTINLVDVACSSGKDMDKFWQIFDERLDLCYRALMCRHKRLLDTPSDVAPILWQYGALARLKKGETINKLLYNGYSTISLGYAGLCECTRYMTGHSHTDPESTPFALQVMQHMNDACAKWREETNIDFSLYGTPLESTTYKFAKCLQKRFGIIEGVTDRGYITNSYHVHVTEKINAFDKLKFEAQFQELSPGGAISYVEVPNMENNIEAVLNVMKYIYDNIMYAELNTKSDYCQCCGYTGQIQIVTDEHGKLIWECPNCGNTDQNKMNVARRTCGYIGTQFWNQGRTQEIKERVLHL